jgi:uridine phosphorylase
MDAIGASELIITPQGKVYHLNVAREDIANTIITVGDPDRVAKVSKHFDTIEFKTQHREFVTHTGRIGNKRLTVLSSGIGPDNIDIVLNELDAVANINFASRTVNEKHTTLNIIRMGTCGSLQADIPVDAHVVSSHGIGLDNLMHFYQTQWLPEEAELAHAFTEHSGLQHSALAPYAVKASQTLQQAFGSEYHHGITVTCPGFYAPQGRVVRAGLRFPNLVDQLNHFHFKGNRISNFEMETSAILGLCRVLGHEGIAVNTVVANRVLKAFSTAADVAIEQMITKALAVLETLPESPSNPA